jgi:hypothetical protein
MFLLTLLAGVALAPSAAPTAAEEGCVGGYSSGPNDPPIVCAWDGEPADSGGLAIYYCDDGVMRALPCWLEPE